MVTFDEFYLNSETNQSSEGKVKKEEKSTEVWEDLNQEVD